jgi:hypothetical protein
MCVGQIGSLIADRVLAKLVPSLLIECYVANLVPLMLDLVLRSQLGSLNADIV